MRFRITVIAIGVILALSGVAWGVGVFSALEDGGFNDPDSESSQATEHIEEQIGRADFDAVLLYSSDSLSVRDNEFLSALRAQLESVESDENVAALTSVLTARTSEEQQRYISESGDTTYVTVQLDGDDDAARADSFNDVEDTLARSPSDEISVEIGGGSAVFSAINSQLKKDVARAEIIAMPIVLLISIVIFGSVIASLMPLITGGIAVLGAFTVLHIITMFSDVSVFAINIITVLGMGLAIDYALFIVSRFREELDTGVTPTQAAVRSVMTAGRTVAVSGVVVSLSLSGLLVFPQLFLRSMAYGSIAAVMIAAIVSVTVLPAILALLGERINALSVRRFFRRKQKGAADKARWEQVARSVMRRPIVFSVAAVAVLVVLALPFLNVQFGNVDEKMLPEDSAARVATENFRETFPETGTTRISVFAPTISEENLSTVQAELSDVQNVEAVDVTGRSADASVFTVYTEADAMSTTAQNIVRDIRELDVDAQLQVTGQSAILVDLLESMRSHLPLMLAIVGAATFVLLMIAFGSIVLPLKALLMNVISLGASFGVVTWIFQEGHLADQLGFTPTGYIDATQPVLMVAILFGLSMDYELFLLSRVREEWDATGDNSRAVEKGLARTGGIITSAALLLSIVVGGFILGDITFMTMLGVGMVVAIFVDATIVRILLVPATMRLLGRYNWWLPGPLARWDAARRRTHIHPVQRESSATTQRELAEVK